MVQFHSGQRPVAGCCEHDDEPSTFIKGGNLAVVAYLNVTSQCALHDKKINYVPLLSTERRTMLLPKRLYSAVSVGAETTSRFD
jgi:hypothetical protein